MVTRLISVTSFCTSRYAEDAARFVPCARGGEGKPTLNYRHVRVHQSESVPAGDSVVFAYSEINQRDGNGDSFIVAPLSADAYDPITLMAIADGMGGHAHGEHVSYETIKRVALSLFEELTLARCLNRFPPAPLDESQTIGAALVGSILQANHHVRRIIETNKWGMAGSTITAAVVHRDTLAAANVGDSPLYHLSAATNQLTRISADHSVTGMLVQAGVIPPELRRTHSTRGRIEHFIGKQEIPVEETLVFVSLSPGDRLLICSDGVVGETDDSEIGDLLSDQSASLMLIAQRLSDLAISRGEKDNLTLILWEHSAPHSPIGVVTE